MCFGQSLKFVTSWSLSPERREKSQGLVCGHVEKRSLVGGLGGEV